MNWPMLLRLQCPCGSEGGAASWRAHSKSLRYRLRCPRCGLQSVATSVRPEAAVELWNEAVVLKRDLRR